MNIPTRTQFWSTNDGIGTKARVTVATWGMMTPTIRMTQTIDPRAIISRIHCLLSGTLPNKRTVAQPSTALSSLPAKRPTTAKTDPTMATRRVYGRSYSGALDFAPLDLADAQSAQSNVLGRPGFANERTPSAMYGRSR